MAFELSDDDLTQAIADTEQEIFSSSTGGDLDPEDVESWDDIIEDQSRMHGWDDSLVDDAKLARDPTGDTPIGMSMGVDDDDLDAARQEGFNQGAQALYRELAPHLPRQEPADMFADPERWRAELLAEARGGQGVTPLPSQNTSVDMFGDPEGFRQQTINDIRTQRAVDQWNTDRVNSSMGYAHRRYGQDFETAYTNVTKGLDASNPAHRHIVSQIVNDADPGAAIMKANDFLQTANASSERFGGPPFAPGLVRPQRAPLRNSAGDGPRSREEALEQSIFNDATGLDEIWRGF
jgi:hypothetical protein